MSALYIDSAGLSADITKIPLGGIEPFVPQVSLDQITRPNKPHLRYNKKIEFNTALPKDPY